MHLAALDWAILAVFLAGIVGLGLSYSRFSGRDLSSFFLGGRKLPWYVAGVSMVATTFAADTPLAVADLTGSSGISGNWLWWNMLLGGLLTTFFFARLWRRAGVLTEVELIELRYAGAGARILRAFKSVYLGVFLNVLIIGWVSQAMITLLQAFLGVGPQAALLLTFGLMALTALYSAFAGLTGIAVTDGIQFVFAVGSCIVLAVVVVGSPEVGGMANLREALPEGSLDFFPAFGSGDGSGGGMDLARLVVPAGAFLAMVGMQWWASWYPGAEPGGGGYVAQRMMATPTERGSVGATLLFNALHYGLRPWPWIVVGLAALVIYDPGKAAPGSAAAPAVAAYIGEGADPEWFLMNEGAIREAVAADPDWSGYGPEFARLGAELRVAASDSTALRKALQYTGNKQLGYVYAMTDFLPSGLAGLLLAAFVAAFMSTISTQLNWGASYLVNDLYARFLWKGGSRASVQEADPAADRHLVRVSRGVTLALMIVSLAVAASFDSIKQLWLFLIEAGAGLGLVLILRWYWWRINAWGELAATLGSMGFFAVARLLGMDYPASFFFIVGSTTGLWMIVNFATRPTDRLQLVVFYRRVAPPGAWGPVRRGEAEIAPPRRIDPLSEEKRREADARHIPEVRSSVEGENPPTGWLVLAWLSTAGLLYSVLFLSGAVVLGTGDWTWAAGVAGFGLLFAAAVRFGKLFR